MIGRARGLVRFACVAGFLRVLVCYPCLAQGVSSDWSNMLDYMVQDVCVDENNRLMSGISPLDSSCKHHRNLLPTELLTYHKNDWPNRVDCKKLVKGYQRSDSYPIITQELGPVVIQTFDFGSSGREFGEFDYGDGGQAIAFSKNTSSIILTEDGGGGLQLITGPTCQRGKVVEPSLLLDSWLIADRRADEEKSGDLVAALRIVTTESCPSEFDSAYTKWGFKDIRYRSSLNGDLSSPLHTLISSHFGGKNLASATHLERFYFTRELGLTRWERWQNPKFDPIPTTTKDRAARLTASRRCEAIEPPPDRGWLMVDCREWTNISPPDSTDGDQPNFWLEKLQLNELTKAIFQ